jgi:hypothetical protein
MGAAVFLGFFVCFCIMVIPQRFEYGRQLISQYNNQNKQIDLLAFINDQNEQLDDIIANLQHV